MNMMKMTTIEKAFADLIEIKRCPSFSSLSANMPASDFTL